MQFVINPGTKIFVVKNGHGEAKTVTGQVRFDQSAVIEVDPNFWDTCFWVRIGPNPQGLEKFAVTVDDAIEAHLMNWQRVEGAPEPGVPLAKSTRVVPDGTYTVVFSHEDDYATIRFETSKNERKMDGSVNTWYGKQFVQYLAGPDNDLDFQSFGTWENGDVRVWRKHQNSMAIARYVKAALIVAQAGDRGQYGEAYALRSGRCSRCGHKLTVPASLHRGMGPDCAAKGGY